LKYWGRRGFSILREFQVQTTWNTDCADDADSHGCDRSVFKTTELTEDTEKNGKALRSLCTLWLIPYEILLFRNERFGSEIPNLRVSAASAFPFRFDEYYFITPKNQAKNQLIPYHAVTSALDFMKSPHKKLGHVF
jgi:hypothetical protein